MAVLKAARLPHGLVPIFIEYALVYDIAKTTLISVSTVSPESGRYRTASVRLGSRGDSYYEYLLLALSPVLRSAQITDLFPAGNSIFRL